MTYLFEIISVRIPKENMVAVVHIMELLFHTRLIFGGVRLFGRILTLCKKWILLLIFTGVAGHLNEVVIGRGKLSMSQYVLDKVRWVLCQ